MKTKSIFLLTFLLVSCLASAQSYIPLQQHMQGVSGAEKITNLAEVEADLGRFTNLSATTGILSTANAQTLNVTGNATVNGFNYIASPTLNGASSTESTSTSVVGGIWNGDFSEGEGLSQIITNGELVTGLNYYNTYGGLGGAGNFSIINGQAKLSATTADDDSYVYLRFPFDVSNNAVPLPLNLNTSYRLSFNYKIEGASATASSGSNCNIRYYVYLNGVPNGEAILVNTANNADWTSFSGYIYTGTVFNGITFRFLLGSLLATIYFDDIKLEQVTTHTNNSTTPTVAYPVITGVSSEFVDQQNTTQDGTYANIGNTGASNYWLKQTFTPTQQKLSAISFMKGSSVGSPTGNMIIEIRNPANAVIASVNVEKSTWDSYTDGNVYTIPVFALLDEDVANYSVVFHSDVAETAGNYYRIYWAATGSYSGGQQGYSTDNGSSWTLSGADLYFKTHYAENTRQITFTNSSTGTSTTVDWGDDGLPDGAVVDLYNGTMTWAPLTATQNNTNNFSKFFGSMSSVSSGGLPNSLLSPTNLFFHGFYFRGDANHDIYGKDGFMVITIPAKYIISANVSVRYYSSTSTSKILYSFDGTDWVEAITYKGTFNGITTFNIANLNREYVHVKLVPAPGGSYTWLLNTFSFTATLDTSAIAPMLLASGANTILQSVNGGSYKANTVIKSVSGGFQTTLNETNKQVTVLRNAPRSYLETPDKTTNVLSITNDELTSISGPVQVNGATIMNASTTPAYDIALPYNSGGAIGSSWNTYSETKYKNIISDVTEASYANIASRLAGVQSKMVTRKIPDAVKAKFFDAEIEWVTDVVSVTEELKTQVVEPVYEVVKLDSKVVLDSKTTEDQLLTAEASPKIVSYVTKEVSVLRSPGEYPRQEFRGWKVRAGVDEATKKQLENLYLKPHPEPIADTAPEAYRVPEGFAWSKWVEESTIYQNWILPQIINELPKLRKRLEALEAMEAVK